MAANEAKKNVPTLLLAPVYLQRSPLVSLKPCFFNGSAPQPKRVGGA
jgi:hypothetical protein